MQDARDLSSTTCSVFSQPSTHAVKLHNNTIYFGVCLRHNIFPCTRLVLSANLHFSSSILADIVSFTTFRDGDSRTQSSLRSSMNLESPGTVDKNDNARTRFRKVQIGPNNIPLLPNLPEDATPNTVVFFTTHIHNVEKQKPICHFSCFCTTIWQNYTKTPP